MPQFLYPLLLLACPIGMGLMMWFMTRGGLHAPRRSSSVGSPVAHYELDELRKELASATWKSSPEATRCSAWRAASWRCDGAREDQGSPSHPEN